MPLRADLLSRKQTDFVLWLAKPPANAPVLVIGQFQPGNPPRLPMGNGLRSLLWLGSRTSTPSPPRLVD